MKLLIISPSVQRGGVEEYMLTVASEATRESWNVHAAFPQTPGTAYLIQDFAQQGVSYYPLAIDTANSSRFKALTEYLPHLTRTVSVLLHVKPDVILISLPWADYCFGVLLACALLNIPTVVVFQLVSSRFEFTQHKINLYRWIRTRHQQWVAVSEANRQLICDSFQILPHEVLCIFNGAKILPVAQDQAEIERLGVQVRQELKLPETSQIALTVGRLAPQKGYSDLIPIIPDLVRDFPDLQFVWVGEGEQQNELCNNIQEAGIEDKVLLLGYRSDIPRLLHAADLFVFPTHYEGLPFALLEAMAHQLPVVASDASSIPEILEDKVHGRLFRSGDRYNLVETLRWALQHPTQMQDLAQNAKLRVQEFSEERMLKETLELLKKLSGVS